LMKCNFMLSLRKYKKSLTILSDAMGICPDTSEKIVML
jgi:hypothetical protein